VLNVDALMHPDALVCKECACLVNKHIIQHSVEDSMHAELIHVSMVRRTECDVRSQSMLCMKCSFCTGRLEANRQTWRKADNLYD
jgi:hypothetical protein